MYKYTARPDIVLRFKRVRQSGGRWWDKEWAMIGEYCTTYQEKVMFQMHYAGTVHYSPRALRQIPVHGYLFPAELFVMETVDQ